MGHTITRERWVTHALDPVERPNLIYEYYVSGRGQFAWDMLRFDHCWPVGPEDAARMDRNDYGLASKRLRSIRMRSYKQPEIARWATFGWSVGNHDLQEK